MNLLFLVTMIIVAIFSLGFLFIPQLMMTPFGVTLDAVSKTFAQIFGSALLGFAFLLRLARKSEKFEVKKTTVYTMFAYYLVSTVVLVFAVTGGMLNSIGWGLVGLHGILTIWFGIYLYK